MKDQSGANIVDIDETIAFLNELLKLNSMAINRLFTYRSRIGKRLSDHPTVQIGGTEDKPTVGFLGILNGLFGIDEIGYGFITAVTDGQKIIRFERTRKERDGS